MLIFLGLCVVPRLRPRRGCHFRFGFGFFLFYFCFFFFLFCVCVNTGSHFPRFTHHLSIIALSPPSQASFLRLSLSRQLRPPFSQSLYLVCQSRR